MRKLACLSIVFLTVTQALQSLRAAPLTGHALFDHGVHQFQDQRYLDAMDDFIHVLAIDPANAQAHTYVKMIARELYASHKRQVQDTRLTMLADVAQRLELNRRNPEPVKNAISEVAQAEAHNQDEHWHAWCDEAAVEARHGHLLAANDLVLRILNENPRYPDAQRLLSDLQSKIHDALLSGPTLTAAERFALEGFYAYGQADYPAAATAWNKASALVKQTADADVGVASLASLRFEPYQKIAQAYVDEQQRQGEIRTLFDSAKGSYEAGRFSQALEGFRRIAILSPEYPQLAHYLVAAETADERERSRRLGEQKRQQVARLLADATGDLERGRYPEAAKGFQHVLAMDPGHSQAKSYLAMAQAELQRRHDPKAAQAHYEAGLIAYASGKLDDALREWRLATRLDADHQKAAIALSKVQKELALAREVPGE